MNIRNLQKGDRVMSLYDDGWHGSIVYADVVRVNRVTVTVRNERGAIVRVDPDCLDGKLTDVEKVRSYEFFPAAPAKEDSH